MIRPKITWTEEHDVVLCREILAQEPYAFKHGSRGRGRCWDQIAEALNKIEWPKYSVDQRAVRDRFVKVEKGYKRKTREELKASGIAPPEMSELDQALEEIIERKENAEQEKATSCKEKQQEKEKERQTAEGVRRRAIESLSQTRAREGIKKRKSCETSDYVGYLKQKREVDLKLHESQLNLKRRKVDVEERRVQGEMELKQREILLKEKELNLKEKELELIARKTDSFLERFG